MLDKTLPIADKKELVAYMESFCKPKSDWMVGIEYEVFPYMAEELCLNE